MSPEWARPHFGQALARALDCSFQRVQFTSDMLPSDVLGISIYSAIEQQFEFKRGPIFTNVLLADEINRTTPKTQSALLEAMNEGQVTVDSHSYSLPQPFLVIATQNPVEHHGPIRCPSRSSIASSCGCGWDIPTTNPSAKSCARKAGLRNWKSRAGPVAAADVLEMQHAVTQVRVDDSLVSYVLAIVRETRDSEHFSLGVSPRGSQMLYRAGQAMAFLDGRTFCVPEDFKPLVVAVFAHRVAVNGRLFFYFEEVRTG